MKNKYKTAAPNKEVSKEMSRSMDGSEKGEKKILEKITIPVNSPFTHSTPVKTPTNALNLLPIAADPHVVVQHCEHNKKILLGKEKRTISVTDRIDSFAKKEDGTANAKPILKVHADLSTRLVTAVEETCDTPKAKKRLSFSNQLECSPDNAPTRPKPILKQTIISSLTLPCQTKTFININSLTQR